MLGYYLWNKLLFIIIIYYYYLLLLFIYYYLSLLLLLCWIVLNEKKSLFLWLKNICFFFFSKIVQLFLTPLKNSKIINPNEFSQLFSNIRDIRNLNELILNEMQTQSKSIGEIFLFYTEYLKMYTKYCADQPLALLTLQKLEKKYSTFKNFLVETKVIVKFIHSLTRHDALHNNTSKIVFFFFFFLVLAKSALSKLGTR